MKSTGNLYKLDSQRNNERISGEQSTDILTLNKKKRWVLLIFRCFWMTDLRSLLLNLND